MDLLKKQNRGEVIEAALEEFVERHDPIKVAERAEKRKFERAITGANQAPATRPVYKNGKRTSTPRPITNAALRAAQGQCTWLDAHGKRCPNRRYLDKHHKQLVSEGGEHSLPNISVLCSSHHRRHHRIESGPSFVLKDRVQAGIE